MSRTENVTAVLTGDLIFGTEEITTCRTSLKVVFTVSNLTDCAVFEVLRTVVAITCGTRGAVVVTPNRTTRKASLPIFWTKRVTTFGTDFEILYPVVIAVNFANVDVCGTAPLAVSCTLDKMVVTMYLTTGMTI
ncbi:MULTISPECIES: hypothetical protein [Haloferax]|uniref:hypothetical protein n=1 Tax=Haloferax TaxID=2251 RepID=UPI0023DBD7D1|nr:MULTISPECIES: hypothetical protein [Haloferax]MDS0243562.1 hypothetical protein [Haloferax sp. S2CR25]MDS0446683.1 hypothetical protein [Haloferax sp. S2CR25-2]